MEKRFSLKFSVLKVGNFRQIYSLIHYFGVLSCTFKFYFHIQDISCVQGALIFIIFRMRPFLVQRCIALTQFTKLCFPKNLLSLTPKYTFSKGLRVAQKTSFEI